MPKVTWEVLRFELTTRQLVALAAQLDIDITDIPVNTQRKRKIAERLWQQCSC